MRARPKQVSAHTSKKMQIDRRAFVTTLPALLVAAPASAAGWQLIDDDNGVRVFRKDVASSQLLAFRGEAVFPHPAEAILWVLADNQHRTEWVDRLVESVVLERRSDYEQVIYSHFELPAVISDRDYVYSGRATRSKATGRVTLALQSVTHPKAPPTVGVRAHLIGSSYVLIPEAPNRTRVEVEIHTDPKGLLPSWLVNFIQKNWPMKTLTALREQTGKPHVGRLALPPAT